MTPRTQKLALLHGRDKVSVLCPLAQRLSSPYCCHVGAGMSTLLQVTGAHIPQRQQHAALHVPRRRAGPQRGVQSAMFQHKLVPDVAVYADTIPHE
jgi:hypothetical protein